MYTRSFDLSYFKLLANKIHFPRTTHLKAVNKCQNQCAKPWPRLAKTYLKKVPESMISTFQWIGLSGTKTGNHRFSHGFSHEIWGLSCGNHFPLNPTCEASKHRGWRLWSQGTQHTWARGARVSASWNGAPPIAGWFIS